MMIDKRKNLRYIVLAALVFTALTAAGLMTLDLGVIHLPFYSHPMYLSGWRDVPFDSKVWKEGNPTSGGQLGSRGPGRDNRRAQMVDDLIAHHLHKGMQKDKVEQMLGEMEAGGNVGPNGDEVAYYSLMAYHSRDQKVVAWTRWRSSDPLLMLTYRKGTLKLQDARVTGR